MLVGVVEQKPENDDESGNAKETTKYVTANATLSAEGAHLWTVGACSQWKATDSGRLGCSGISAGCKDSEWSQDNHKAISR